MKNFLNDTSRKYEDDPYIYEHLGKKSITSKLFLLWWVQLVILVFSSIIINNFDWWEFLYQGDKTKISFIILFLFTISTIATGLISYYNNYYLYNKSKEYLWFITETMISLGLIGTVAGFMLMFGDSFHSLNIDDTASVQKAIASMSYGMSTALLTTLIGLISSSLLKIQLIIIENNLQDPYKDFEDFYV